MAAAKPFAIIAGVGTGTGSAIARRFARAPYSIVVLARNPENYNGVVQEIQAAGGQAMGISADVTDPGSMQRAFGQAASEHGDSNLAAAVYNVGGVCCPNVVRKASESAVYV